MAWGTWYNPLNAPAGLPACAASDSAAVLIFGVYKPGDDHLEGDRTDSNANSALVSIIAVGQVELMVLAKKDLRRAFMIRN